MLPPLRRILVQLFEHCLHCIINIMTTSRFCTITAGSSPRTLPWRLEDIVVVPEPLGEIALSPFPACCDADGYRWLFVAAGLSLIDQPLNKVESIKSVNYRTNDDVLLVALRGPILLQRDKELTRIAILSAISHTHNSSPMVFELQPFGIVFELMPPYRLSS